MLFFQDPGDAVDKIAKFLRRKISPETRDLIVRQTSFDAMKSSSHTNFTWFEGIKGDGFIRKGQVGGWKDYFTEEQNELFDKVFSERVGDGETAAQLRELLSLQQLRNETEIQIEITDPLCLMIMFVRNVHLLGI